MRLIAAILGTIVFFFIAPFTIAGVIPWLITDWHVRLPEYANPVAQGIGAAMAGMGTIFLLDSFARFALKGLGTPAPVAPPKHLVVSGLYRYVRNPMYVGVGLVIAGQCLAFRSLPLVVWLALFTAAVTVFVVGYEQPTLRAQYGASYDAYCRSVPAVVPRLRRRTRSTRSSSQPGPSDS